MSVWISLAVVLVMLIGVVLIPVGLPGLWLIVAVTLGLALAGHLAWAVVLTAAALAVMAEAAELLVVARFGRAYGGSRRAFWGAVLGGMVGLLVGTPVPLLGPVLAGFVGTFLGAGAVTLMETRSLRHSARVGWGVLLARTAAVALKVAVAVGVVGVVGVALIL